MSNTDFSDTRIQELIREWLGDDPTDNSVYNSILRDIASVQPIDGDIAINLTRRTTPPQEDSPTLEPDPIEDDEENMYLQRIGYVEEEKPKTREIDLSGGVNVWGQQPLTRPVDRNDIPMGQPPPLNRNGLNPNYYANGGIRNEECWYAPTAGIQRGRDFQHHNTDEYRYRVVVDPDGTRRAVEINANGRDIDSIDTTSESYIHDALEEVMCGVFEIFRSFEQRHLHGSRNYTDNLLRNIESFLTYKRDRRIIDRWSVYQSPENRAIRVSLEKNGYRLHREFMV